MFFFLPRFSTHTTWENRFSGRSFNMWLNDNFFFFFLHNGSSKLSWLEKKWEFLPKPLKMLSRDICCSLNQLFLWTLNCHSLKQTNRYWFQWFMDWHFVPQGTKTLIFMWIFFPHQQTNSTDGFDIFSWKWATFWKIKWPCSNSRRVEIQYLSTMHHRLPSVNFSLIEK